MDQAAKRAANGETSLQFEATCPGKPPKLIEVDRWASHSGIENPSLACHGELCIVTWLSGQEIYSLKCKKLSVAVGETAESHCRESPYLLTAARRIWTHGARHIVGMIVSDDKVRVRPGILDGVPISGEQPEP